jgi:glycosyltransferase involved in cell wall biosynthesis
VLIAMVSEHANPLAALGGHEAGGQNAYVAALATHLARRGCRVTVHTRRDGRGPRRVALAPGVEVDHVPAGPARPVPRDDLLPHMDELADQLAQAWRRERPDVVHAHFWMSGRAALAAARPFDLPVVQTFHALGSVKRREQGPHDTSPRCRVAQEAAIAARADSIVATCTDETRELIAMGADPARIAVVPCGVDLDVFTPDGPAAPRRTGRHRLVAVGRLVPRKGLADAICALAALPDTELVVAGGPPARSLGRDPEVRRLVNLARRCGVGDQVRFSGRMDPRGVAGLLRSADALVAVPWYEPFGMVALEAMACGVPVVASAVGGLLDTVVDGVTGVHVPPRDAAALAAALRRLLDDPDRRAVMGRAGRVRAQERYAWPEVAAQVHDVYQHLVTAGRRAPGVARR